MPEISLRDLAARLGAEAVGDARITGLAYDSRRTAPGDLFCAMAGFHTDGHRFIGEAVRRGARACLVEQRAAVPQDVPCIVVPQSRRATALAAAIFFGHPGDRLWMVGVTGTNGKTTTTHLIRSLLQFAGVPTGLTGTVHTLMGDKEESVTLTTPEAPDLQALLSNMVDAGMHACVMEVSSQALAQDRVEGTHYDVGVFTNLTQDHLDFHRDFEDYFQAKARLFESLANGPHKGPQAAVLNADDPWARRLVGLTRAPVVTFGMDGPADVTADHLEFALGSTHFDLGLPGHAPIPVRVPLSGRFNVSNALAAAAVAHVRGLDPVRVAEGLEQVQSAPGRFERIDCGQPFLVVVDYAHTPDGMENALSTARHLARGRLAVVFGCGGDRDREKRVLMGRVAGRLADVSVITVDNPRSEEPEAIVDEVVRGVRDAGGVVRVEMDRTRAIRWAVGQAGPGDVLVIAGKGHETYQIYRTETVHFDDREEARAALAACGYTCP